MHRIVVYCLTCVLVMSAGATTIVLPTDEQLTTKSTLIVEGTVVRTQAIERGRSIWTETVVNVSKVLKGSAGNTVTIRELGGVLGNRVTKIFGAPEYVAGEQVLLFLAPTSHGDYQTVDMFVGKFSRERMLDGRALWLRDDSAGEVTLLDARFQPIHARNVQREAAAFERFLTDRLAGRPGTKNYGVANPVLARDFPLGTVANFTTLAEPTIYRWSTFDNGGSVSWVSVGVQPGYPSGGVDELQTAMAAWTSYTAARINYTYTGTSTTNGGLSAPNGVNEVLFNDPNQEIAGTWNPSTGGVVGRGGFNGASTGRSWTAPFTADAQHQQMTYTVYDIAEGNLTIQDNVSAGTGMSSERLAEIIAHELGHTLGFGHSSDGSALMYASLTNLGASLRADDQTAARWLYPSGNAAPPPPPPPPPVAQVPAAPSNLTASVDGTTVALHWTDNANNETGYAIYVSEGSNPFLSVADLEMNSTATWITGFGGGSFRIYVQAYNAAGSSSPSNTVTVSVSTALSAAFAVAPPNGVAGETTFSFIDQSVGNISGHSWDYGDGATSSSISAMHVYSAPGHYTITLTVTGGGAQSSTSHSVDVAAPGPAAQPVHAAFAVTPSSGVAGQTVFSLVDQSTGAIVARLWQLGDGSTATNANPTHVYAAAGNYAITLSVNTDTSQSSTMQYVNVSAHVPETPVTGAEFDFTPSRATVGQSVSFRDRSWGAPSSWAWSFGDGSGSAQQNPTHTYTAPGSYKVELTAAAGIVMSTNSHYVEVVPAAAIPDVTTFRSLVSVTAQTNGMGGSIWRTELNVFNAGSESARLEMTFIPSKGGAVQSRSLVLGSRQCMTWRNALPDLFGMTAGAGALAIDATSATTTPALKISSRTFNEGTGGTYGQAVPDVAAKDLSTRSWLPALVSTPGFRTNLGLVNRGSAAATVTLTLYDSEGVEIGSSNVVLQPNNFEQGALTSFFPAANNHESMSLRSVTSDPDVVSIYASVVDNRTQDPVYLQSAAASTAARVIIPAAGRAAGANGTFWRSDLVLLNESPFLTTVYVRYLVAGKDNRDAPVQSVAIRAGSTRVITDVLSWFGLTAGSGALELTWSGGVAPIIASRTYTTDATGGTYGQSIDPVMTFGRDLYVAGLRSDSAYRSNIGFVNGGDEAMNVNVTLLSPTGETLATGSVSVQPRSQTQYGLASLFPSVNTATLGNFTLQARTNGGPALFAYGSMVDNATGDPVFFAGE